MSPYLDANMVSISITHIGNLSRKETATGREDAMNSVAVLSEMRKHFNEKCVTKISNIEDTVSNQSDLF